MKTQLPLFALVAVVLTSMCVNQQNQYEQQSQEQISSEQENTVQTSGFDPASFGSPNPRIKQQIPQCCNHPYWHNVYRAFSDDGVSFQKEGTLLKEHASVPAILQKDDGSFILYYVDGEYDTTGCSVSQDGKTFTAGNCRIYGFTEEKAWDPYVIKINSSFYMMYFFAPKPSGENRIMSAISKDGISWLQEPGIRFQYQGVLDPAVIRFDGQWRMYMGDNSQGSPLIIVANSSDGLNFAKEYELDLGGNVPEIVKLDNGQYALYFCKDGISYVTSSSGYVWSSAKQALSPEAQKIVCDPSIIKLQDGKWAMYYKTQ